MSGKWTDLKQVLIVLVKKQFAECVVCDGDDDDDDGLFVVISNTRFVCVCADGGGFGGDRCRII